MRNDDEQGKGIPPSSRNDRGKWGDKGEDAGGVAASIFPPFAKPGGHSERSEEPLHPKGPGHSERSEETPSMRRQSDSERSEEPQKERERSNKEEIRPLVMTRIEE